MRHSNLTCLMIHRQHDFPESWLSRRIIYTKHDGVHVYTCGGEIVEIVEKLGKT